MKERMPETPHIQYVADAATIRYYPAPGDAAESMEAADIHYVFGDPLPFIKSALLDSLDIPEEDKASAQVQLLAIKEEINGQKVPARFVFRCRGGKTGEFQSRVFNKEEIAEALLARLAKTRLMFDKSKARLSLEFYEDPNNPGRLAAKLAVVKKSVSAAERSDARIALNAIKRIKR